MKRFFGFLILVPVLCGCGPSRFLNNPGYKNEAFRNRFVYIEPVNKEQIKIEIIGHFVDDFQPKPGSDYQQILADTINSRMLDPFKKLSGKNEFSNERIELADSDYFEVEKSLHAGTKDEIAFRFKIPKPAALTAKSIRPDICIITRDYAFGTNSTSGMHVTPSGGMASSSNRTLNLDLKYVMWDYQKNDFISYGIAFGSVQAKYFIVKGDWLAIIDRSLDAVIFKSPFKRLVPQKAQPGL